MHNSQETVVKRGLGIIAALSGPTPGATKSDDDSPEKSKKRSPEEMGKLYSWQLWEYLNKKKAQFVRREDGVT